MTKLTWKGEDGASDVINIGGYKLRPNRGVDVPAELAAVYALNPFFIVEDGTSGGDTKTPAVKGATGSGGSPPTPPVPLAETPAPRETTPAPPAPPATPAPAAAPKTADPAPKA